MRIIIALAVCAALTSCGFDGQNGSKLDAEGTQSMKDTGIINADDTQVLDEVGIDTLLGRITKEDLMRPPHRGWMQDGRASLASLGGDDSNVNVLDDSNVTYEIYMGTWCEDSQREVPKFLKMADILGIDDDAIKMIAVSGDKTEPADLVAGKDIQYVPTIIVMVDGKEKGRFVEQAQKSLPEDLVDIITTDTYKHVYEN